jgi:hypothetical protein
MDESSVMSSSLKVGKKFYQPFGTPSHTKHAYSEFSHISFDSKGFASQLASTKDFELPKNDNEEDEEESEFRRRRNASSQAARKKPTIKKKSKENGDESVPDEDEFKEEDLQPCTKPGCQQVIRAIADIEYTNEIERLELEEKCERLLSELQASQQDILSAEAKLNKLNDIGDHLEMQVTSIMAKVEELDKKNVGLVEERGEINSKVSN